MDRQHRHDLKHDRFVDEVGVWSGRAVKNQRLLLAIAGTAVAIAVIVFGVHFYRSTREAKAQAAMADAIEAAESPVGVAAATPGEAAPKFKTEQERDAAAEKQFKDIQEKYSGTDAADVAGLYVARAAASRGDAATARQLLERFVSRQGSHMLAATARFSLYQLRIEGGEAAQVVVELNAELAKQEPVLPADSLLVLLATAYEQQGNAAKSAEAYRRIATEFPESPFALAARRRAGEA